MKNAPLEVVEENADSEKILIVDRKGHIGEAISSKLKSFYDVYFVSENSSPNLSNVNFIALRGKIPVIPNSFYSQIIIIYDKSLYDSGQIWEFIKKAKTDGSKLIILISIFEQVRQELTEKIIDLYKNSKIIFFGDVFPFPHYSPVNNILRMAKRQGEIKIKETGLGILYPLSLKALSEGVMEIFFGLGKQKVSFLFPKNPPTELSFARALQKTEPFLKVDFLKEKGAAPIALPKAGEYLEKGSSWEIDLKDVTEDYPVKKEIVKAEKKKEHFNLFRLILVYFVFTFFLLPLIVPLFLGAFGLMELKGSKNSLDSGNFENAKREAKTSEFFFNLSLSSATPLFAGTSLVGQKSVANLISEKINTGRDFSEIIYYASESLDSFKNVLEGKDSKQNFAKGSNNLRRVLEISQKVKNKNDDLKNFEPFLQILINTQEAFPSLLGFEGKKDYLLLFQNNMELRPGGGFIGSYGLLSLNNGKVEDFKIHDVYDADGQLKGHIEPPFAIRRFLPSAHWYLRDSNFDIDFNKNASVAAYFLKEETGKTVDGVIGLDISLVKNIISALGSVYVPDYSQNVNSDNLYLLTQTHAEKDFFPGSTQKKDFLNALFTAIILKLSTSKEIPYTKLAKSFGESIIQKHLLLASSDPYIQSVCDINKLSSSLRENKQNNDSTVEDFLGISEANIGVNKANYFIKRKVIKKTSIDENGNVFGKLTIKYINTAEKNVWPGGDYRNYLRIILPLNASLMAVSIDNKNLSLIPAVTDPLVYESKNFTPPEGLEIEKTSEYGKTIYGFLTTVPVGQLQTIDVSYSLFLKAPINLPSFKYNLNFSKQPGTDEYPYEFSVSLPSPFVALAKTEGMFADGNSASFANNIDTDKEFVVEFTKK